MTLISTIAFVASWVGSTLLGMLIGAELIRKQIDGLTIMAHFPVPEKDKEAE